jgi:hypothetical protein
MEGSEAVGVGCGWSAGGVALAPYVEWMQAWEGGAMESSVRREGARGMEATEKDMDMRGTNKM